MWRNDTFTQRNKVIKRAGEFEKDWGQYRWGPHNIGGVTKSLVTIYIRDRHQMFFQY